MLFHSKKGIVVHVPADSYLRDSERARVASPVRKGQLGCAPLSDVPIHGPLALIEAGVEFKMRPQDQRRMLKSWPPSCRFGLKPPEASLNATERDALDALEILVAKKHLSKSQADAIRRAHHKQMDHYFQWLCQASNPFVRGSRQVDGEWVTDYHPTGQALIDNVDTLFKIKINGEGDTTRRQEFIAAHLKAKSTIGLYLTTLQVSSAFKFILKLIHELYDNNEDRGLPLIHSSRWEDMQKVNKHMAPGFRFFFQDPPAPFKKRKRNPDKAF